MSRVDDAIDAAIDAGTIAQSDGKDFIAEQDTRAEAGIFYSTGVGYTGVGVKPV